MIMVINIIYVAKCFLSWAPYSFPVLVLDGFGKLFFCQNILGCPYKTTSLGLQLREENGV